MAFIRQPFRPALMSAELLFYVRRKFTDIVDKHADPGLRDYALISLDGDCWIIWIPRRANYSRPERRRKGHDVWSDGSFTAVIGYKVSDKRVSQARLSSCAAATVVARFPPNHSLAQRGE